MSLRTLAREHLKPGLSQRDSLYTVPAGQTRNKAIKTTSYAVPRAGQGGTSFSGVATAGTACPAGTVQGQRDKGTFGTSGTVGTRGTSGTNLTVEEAERAALAANSVSAVYLDTWARLQCQRPFPVDPKIWQQAIVDAGLFLDQWGALASQFGWSPGDVFDVPAGLVWFIGGSTVETLGPEHARTADNRVFDRMKGTQP